MRGLENPRYISDRYIFRLSETQRPETLYRFPEMEAFLCSIACALSKQDALQPIPGEFIQSVMWLTGDPTALLFYTSVWNTCIGQPNSSLRHAPNCGKLWFVKIIPAQRGGRFFRKTNKAERIPQDEPVRRKIVILITPDWGSGC
jgi:hypothetical protein